jgi:CopG antitoxin of type II toxin-antitoxin system
MRITKKKPMPEFRSEDEERKFWSGNDSTEFIDCQPAKVSAAQAHAANALNRFVGGSALAGRNPPQCFAPKILVN